MPRIRLINQCFPKENNWGKRKIQKEIRMLQSEVKKNLKKGVIKCH